MKSNPFQIFTQFPELMIGIFVKEDNVKSDQEAAEQLGFSQVAYLWQEHGDVTHPVTEPLPKDTKGDGLLTATQNLAISVRFADCQAFVICAPEKKAVGVLHAGWRGMAVKAITAFYKKLSEEFQIDPKNTFVGAAPSLCTRCADFSDPIAELPAHLHPFIDGKCVDLQKAADEEFASLGVPKEHIERHPACTRCDDSLWSWRRNKDEKARNYLIAGLTK